MTDLEQVVLYKREGHYGWITLNRPEKRNALNDELVSALKETLRLANNDDEVRVVVISGTGKDFCAGADLSALRKIARASIEDNIKDARALMELFLLIRQVQVPVIAAVTGRALAGGCGLATACDLVLASADSRFGYPEVKIGFVPAMVLAILRRNVSEKRAFELLTAGEEISAQDALNIGIVNKVFDADSFQSEVDNYLQKFTQTSKSAVSLTKKLLYQVDGLDFANALETGVDVNVIARMTEDCQQGVARFLKK